MVSVPVPATGRSNEDLWIHESGTSRAGIVNASTGNRYGCYSSTVHDGWADSSARDDTGMDVPTTQMVAPTRVSHWRMYISWTILDPCQ